MKGFKTILFGLLIAVGGTTLSYLEGLKQTLGTCAIDVATNVEVCALPDWTALVVGGIIITLRFATTTSIFKK